jgi:hypothetical protein
MDFQPPIQRAEWKLPKPYQEGKTKENRKQLRPKCENSRRKSNVGIPPINFENIRGKKLMLKEENQQGKRRLRKNGGLLKQTSGVIRLKMPKVRKVSLMIFLSLFLN